MDRRSHAKVSIPQLARLLGGVTLVHGRTCRTLPAFPSVHTLNVFAMRSEHKCLCSTLLVH